MQQDKYKTPAKPIAKMTGTELKNLRAQWLDDARRLGDIDAAMKVGQMLGKLVSLKQLPPVKRWISGNIIVDYMESEDDWMTYKRRFGGDKIVSVCIGLIKWERGIMMGDHNNRVLYWSQGDDLTERSKNNVFVPGDWLDPILKAVPDAEKAFEKMIEDKNEEQKAQLVALLSTG